MNENKEFDYIFKNFSDISSIMHSNKQDFDSKLFSSPPEIKLKKRKIR